LNKFSIDDGRNASRSRVTAEERTVSGQSRSATQSRTPARAPTRPPTRPRGHTRPPGHLHSAQSTDEAEWGIRVPIQSNADILEARRRGRELAAELGFPSIDRTLVATAISELARNIILYASHGEIRLARDERLGSSGIIVTATDSGPGIRDLRSVLQDGYSASHALGLGLPGVKRIMDEFDIVSKPRQGTSVTVKKWKPR
jgi:serine/threonine-protein kinase RsbT